LWRRIVVALRIAKRPDCLAILRAEKHENFLRAAVELYEWKEVRLIKDPASNGEKILDVITDGFVTSVAQPFEKRSVRVRDLPVIVE
jgi:hypothetical protein